MLVACFRGFGQPQSWFRSVIEVSLIRSQWGVPTKLIAFTCTAVAGSVTFLFQLQRS